MFPMRSSNLDVPVPLAQGGGPAAQIGTPIIGVPLGPSQFGLPIWTPNLGGLDV
jgi:hypothetical protein